VESDGIETDKSTYRRLFPPPPDYGDEKKSQKERPDPTDFQGTGVHLGGEPRHLLKADVERVGD
jgi:hypothetical protein